jgi:acid phosphatase type 7
MVCPGNHEVEYNTDGSMFLAFEQRYRMPAVKPAEFGEITIQPGVDSKGKPYCASSVFQMEYNYGNSFYSFETGSAHVIYLNPYSTSNTTSVQYQWLESDLKGINREQTPWIIVVMHNPWYNSNHAHYAEAHTVMMRDAMEPLFYKYHVNFAICGHVHAYERTYPVYQNITVPDGVTYVTIGDGGNAEGHAADYYTQPTWSAYRNGTQYGHGEITLWNKNKMSWRWLRNVDGEIVSKDELIICNSAFGPATC